MPIKTDYRVTPDPTYEVGDFQEVNVIRDTDDGVDIITLCQGGNEIIISTNMANDLRTVLSTIS